MKKAMAAILAMLCAAGAYAGPDSDLLAKAGLLGAWARDCSQPPSNSNPYQVIAPSTAGYPTRDLKMDSKIDRTSELRNVVLLGNNQVKFRMMASLNFSDRDITVIVVGNRHRSMDAADASGKKYITNGRFVRDGVEGAETSWFQKCGG